MMFLKQANSYLIVYEIEFKMELIFRDILRVKNQSAVFVAANPGVTINDITTKLLSPSKEMGQLLFQCRRLDKKPT